MGFGLRGVMFSGVLSIYQSTLVVYCLVGDISFGLNKFGKMGDFI